MRLILLIETVQSQCRIQNCKPTLFTIQLKSTKNHKRVLYDITYEKGYKFMKPVMKNHEMVYELDFKYLVALLERPTVNELEV